MPWVPSLAVFHVTLVDGDVEYFPEEAAKAYEAALENFFEEAPEGASVRLTGTFKGEEASNLWLSVSPDFARDVLKEIWEHVSTMLRNGRKVTIQAVTDTGYCLYEVTVERHWEMVNEP